MSADLPPTRPSRTPLLLVVLAGIAIAIALVTTRYSPEHRQGRVLATIGLCLLAGAITLAWWTFFARVRARTRAIGWLLLLGGAVLLASLYSFEGMDGDFRPRFRWRFAKVVEQAAEGSTLAPHRDWPGFLGQNRDGLVPDLELDPDWTKHPPRIVWKRAIGRGWSSFAVAGDRAFTMEVDEARGVETLVALELATGERLAAVEGPNAYRSEIAGDGPRATPAIAGDLVVGLTGTGQLLAMDRASGALRWSANTLAKGGEAPAWGASASPLVLGEHVLVTAGGPSGLLQSWSRSTGTLEWSAGTGGAGYSSPFLATLDGVPQIVTFDQSTVSGFSPEGGSLWTHPWATREDHVAQPLLLGDDRLLVSAGYGRGSECFRVRKDPSAGWSVESLWWSRRLKSKFSNLVRVERSIYGFDDGVLCCLDADSGERHWRDGDLGHGQLLRVGRHLLVLAEDGRLVLIAPDPGEFREVSSFPALEGRTWSHPALAAPYLLVRNDREAALLALSFLGD